MRASATILNLSTMAGLATAAGLKPPTVIPTVQNPVDGLSCPSGMAYSPWVKGCNCPPGQTFNAKAKKCTGDKLTGAWPQPSIDPFAGQGVDLDTFCATSPTKIIPYDPTNDLCKADLSTITFSAPRSIVPELNTLPGKDIDFAGGDVSKDLKDVCAGLSGLYLKDPKKAIDLFNTDNFGLGTSIEDLDGLPKSILSIINGITCLIGLGGPCNHDCVALPVAGCANVLEGQAGGLGNMLEGVNGLNMLGGALSIVDGNGKVVDLPVEGPLCTVGKVLKGLPNLFGSDCSGQ